MIVPQICGTKMGKLRTKRFNVIDLCNAVCINLSGSLSCRQVNLLFSPGLPLFVGQVRTGTMTWFIWKRTLSGADPGGGPGGPGPPLDPRFWGPKIEHFWALFNFSIIFFASLHSAYYFFNMLLFQSSNSKIFQPRFARHMISHLEVFVFSLSFTHFRLLGVHLSLNFFLLQI